MLGQPDRRELGDPRRRRHLRLYEARGNNGNLIIVNDLSCAAAHGLELTFSFNNVVFGNRMSGNAICGLWGGYSQNTLVTGNLFQANGDMGYGLERGGINIEHGRGNRIEHNTFLENACGVHLWWDDDRTLLGLPWARANERGSRDNVLAFNRFRGDAVAVHLRGDVETVITAADVERVDEAIRADDASLYAWQEWDGPWPEPAVPRYHARGESRPRGARDELRGREHIIMTTWGPYDWRRPLVWLEKAAADHHVYRLLGDPPPEAVSLEATGDVRLVAGDEGGRVTVRTDASEALRPYTLRANGAAEPVRGVLAPLRWSVRFFPSKVDPREDEAAWHAGAADAVSVEVETLDLDFGTGGPDQLGLTPNAGLPSDHFGTMALTSVTVPPGRWRLRTVSDDGVRLWLDDELVIDDWTWHAPRENVHELNVTGSARTMRVRVEHFELDGHAVLEVAFEHVTAKTAPP
jgi:parallel beta-helix repeat protein